MEAVFLSGAPEEGIHDLRPLGPWPLSGSEPPKKGRAPGVWGCPRCGRTAGHTSCTMDLARQPCGGAAWVATPSMRALVLEGLQWRCSRCLLADRPQHTAQAERQHCLVAEPAMAGARWLQGEAGLREVFGRLRSFRHFCCPAEEAEESPAAEAGAAMTEGVAEHVYAACAEGSERNRRRAEADPVVVSPHPSLCDPIFATCLSR